MMDQRYKLSVSTGAKAPIFVRLWTARLKPRPFKADFMR